jgi:hypothetical protein
MQPSFFHYVLAYLCWAISVALAALDLLVLRSALMIVLGMTPWSRYVQHAINQFGFLFLAIVCMGFILFTEHFYRTGVEKRKLLPRFLLGMLIGVSVLAFAHLLWLIGEFVLGFFTLTTLIIVIAELAGCALLFWLYRRALLAST